MLPTRSKYLFQKPLLTRLSSTLSSSLSNGFYNSEQKEMRDNLIKLIDTEINPHCAKWEKEGDFPAKEVFRKLGQAGFLGEVFCYFDLHKCYCVRSKYICTKLKQFYDDIFKIFFTFCWNKIVLKCRAFIATFFEQFYLIYFKTITKS